MKLIKILWFLTLIIPFSGLSCYASYGPTGEWGGFPHGGYSSTQINGNTVEVSYDGSIGNSQRTVENYLLYRCAKITQDGGFDYFIITSITTSPIVVTVKTRTERDHYNTNPPRLFTAFPEQKEYVSSTDTTTEMNCRYNPGAPCHPDRTSITAVIKMFHGSIPRGTRRAYNAADVIGHLKPDTLY